MEHFPHWAESLKSGDKIKATLRHQTDGSQNKHNVDVTVISVYPYDKTIIGHTEYGSKEIEFCELVKPETDITGSDEFKGFMQTKNHTLQCGVHFR